MTSVKRKARTCVAYSDLVGYVIERCAILAWLYMMGRTFVGLVWQPLNYLLRKRREDRMRRTTGGKGHHGTKKDYRVGNVGPPPKDKPKEKPSVWDRDKVRD